MATPEEFARLASQQRSFQFVGYVNAGNYKATFHVVEPNGANLALKILKPGVSPERTKREIEAMAKVSCAHVVTLVDVGQVSMGPETCTFFVEPFLDGGTLSARCTGPLAIPAARRLGREVAIAIKELWRHRLVHRDIKPDNVMFRAGSDAAVVVDLGCVRALDEGSLTKTYLGGGPGTPMYAAPEQLNNQKPMIDWRTDQFGLGCTLSWIVLGVHPYGQPGDSVDAAIQRARARQGPASAFVQAAQQAGLPMLERMVQPWPIQRYNDVDQFIATF